MLHTNNKICMENMILIVVYFENSFMFPAFVLMMLFLRSTIAHTLLYAVTYHQATKIEE